jgi:hypothetical protein
MLGGLALAYFIENRRSALAYWSPRKMSSSSFSRRAICFQTGMTTAIITAAMLMATSNAAIA